MNFNDFKNKKIAILFDTEEELEEFLLECDKKGITWCSGEKASSRNYFNRYENICIIYSSRLEYCDKEYCEYEDYSIINYKNFKNNTNEVIYEEIRKIVVNKDTTIIFWNDDTKTLVKKGKDQIYNSELAILYAYFQKHSGLSKTKANKTIQNLVKNIYNQDIKEKHKLKLRKAVKKK